MDMHPRGHNDPMPIGLRIFLSGVGLSALSACSPGLDWREARSLQAGLLVLFPCKPKLDQRTLPVGPAAAATATGAAVPAGAATATGAAVPAGAATPAEWPAALQVCDAQGMTFAVLTLAPPLGGSVGPGPAASGLPTPAQALRALEQSGAQRWGALQTDPLGLAAPQASKLPAALVPQWRRYSRSGPNGQPIETLALFFEHQGAAVQMTLSGPKIDSVAVETFFGGLRLEP